MPSLTLAQLLEDLTMLADLCDQRPDEVPAVVAADFSPVDHTHELTAVFLARTTLPRRDQRLTRLVLVATAPRSCPAPGAVAPDD